MNCSDDKHLGVPFDRYPADRRHHPFKCLMLYNLADNISGKLSFIRYEQRVRSPDSVWNSGNPAFAICFSSCRRNYWKFPDPPTRLHQHAAFLRSFPSLIPLPGRSWLVEVSQNTQDCSDLHYFCKFSPYGARDSRKRAPPGAIFPPQQLPLLVMNGLNHFQLWR